MQARCRTALAHTNKSRTQILSWIVVVSAYRFHCWFVGCLFLAFLFFCPILLMLFSLSLLVFVLSMPALLLIPGMIPGWKCRSIISYCFGLCGVTFQLSLPLGSVPNYLRSTGTLSMRCSPCQYFSVDMAQESGGTLVRFFLCPFFFFEDRTLIRRHLDQGVRRKVPTREICPKRESFSCFALLLLAVVTCRTYGGTRKSLVPTLSCPNHLFLSLTTRWNVSFQT